MKFWSVIGTSYCIPPLTFNKLVLELEDLAFIITFKENKCAI